MKKRELSNLDDTDSEATLQKQYRLEFDGRAQTATEERLLAAGHKLKNRFTLKDTVSRFEIRFLTS